MIRRLEAQNGTSWQDVGQPSTEDLAQLVRDTQLVITDAEFVVQKHQRPEVWTRPGYTLILMQVPVFDRQIRLTRGAPLYFIITATQLWTTHFEQIPVLEKIIDEFEQTSDKREEYFSDGALGLALYIISQMHAASFRKLERLAKHIDIAEDAVFHGNERKMVEESAILKRDVLDFRKIVRPQTHLFAGIPESLTLSPTNQVQWQRLHGQTQKLWEMLEGLYESADELSESNTGLLQHKENELLRLLTYYSTVGLPFYVLMQMFNPFRSDATTFDRTMFWSIFGIFVVILGFILNRFRGKRIL